MLRTLIARSLRVCLWVLMPWLGGCGAAANLPAIFDAGSGIGSGVDGNVDSAPAFAVGRHATGEPNDAFAEAIDVIFDADGIGRIEGAIQSVHDIDVFTLGPMRPGDRIRVNLRGGGGLDANAAVFDGQARIFVRSNDRSNADADPFVDEVVRHADDYYLAVTGSSLAAPAAKVGTYTGVIVIRRGGPVPLPVPQAVLLNFVGGIVSIPGIEVYTIGPFDAAEIDPAYAGQTAAVKQAIVETVRDAYQGIAVDLYDTDSSPAPAGLTASTVYFGGASRSALGMAQSVDSYNRDPFDSAIVLTNSFTPRLFGRVVTSTQLGRAIGNVACMELGHLVGLNHVSNPADIMDMSGTAMMLAMPMSLHDSPLETLVFPMGRQDGRLLLQETLGTAP